MPLSRLVIHAIFAMLPMRGYVHPDRPVMVRFVTAQTARARRSLAVGVRAAIHLGGFTPTALGDVISDGGVPQFHLYTFAGKPIRPLKVRHAGISRGKVNLVRFFPQIEHAGTYILTWKHATPLVIETLDNPPRSAATMAGIRQQIAGMTKAQQKKILAQIKGKPVAIRVQPLQYARIKTKLGEIDARFYYDLTPETINNFIFLARQHYYDGSNFHRVIKTFMIQGGDSVSNIKGRAGSGGPGYEIVQEFNKRPQVRGVLSMARAQSPDSGGAQFFIVTATSDQTQSALNDQYTDFGKVFKGMRIVDKIANTPTVGNNGKVSGPKPPIVSVRIRPATAAMYGIKAGTGG